MYVRGIPGVDTLRGRVRNGIRAQNFVPLPFLSIYAKGIPGVDTLRGRVRNGIRAQNFVPLPFYIDIC
jgi:hypothetical protein